MKTQRRHRTARAAPLIAAAAFVASCRSTQKVEAEDADVSVIVDRVMPKAKSLDASAVEVTLKLMNPSDQPVKIQRIDFEIDTKDVSGTLKGSSASGATIEAAQTAEVTFLESIPFPEEKDAYKVVLGRGTIPANLKGEVVLGDGTKLPFERKGEVATPTLPQFIVFDAQAARYEREGLDVTLFLRLVNENVFPVTIEVVKYTVYVEDKKIKSEQAALGVRLLQGAAEEYEVSTVLDDKSFEKGRVKSILDAGRVSFRVTGKIVLERLEIPFDHTGEIELGSGE